MSRKADSACAFALKMLRELPGATAKELESFAGRTDGQIRKRLADLRDQGRAKVTGSRKCRISGRNAQTWTPIDPAA